MRQGEIELPQGGGHAEGEGGEDEGRGKRWMRGPENERGSLNVLQGLKLQERSHLKFTLFFID